jgi:hypothetical protein
MYTIANATFSMANAVVLILDNRTQIRIDEGIPLLQNPTEARRFVGVAQDSDGRFVHHFGAREEEAPPPEAKKGADARADGSSGTGRKGQREIGTSMPTSRRRRTETSAETLDEEAKAPSVHEPDEKSLF